MMFIIVGVGQNFLNVFNFLFLFFFKDGPALVGDPDLGFGGLRQFGPALVHHTSLKIRSGIEIDDFMMVDSPGMIDSPVSRTSLFDSYSNGGNGTGGLGPSSTSNPYVMHTMDRGYDFEGVVRWLAERADVILLFFDPVSIYIYFFFSKLIFVYTAIEVYMYLEFLIFCLAFNAPKDKPGTTGETLSIRKNVSVPHSLL